MISLKSRSAHLSVSSEGLDRVHDPECNLAVWERDPLCDCEALVQAIERDIRFSCAIDAVGALLPYHLEKSGCPQGPARVALSEDVASLARIYGGLLGLDELTLRLEVIAGNACRKWHADYVSARLITSYFGQGTQWLDDEDAQRVSQGKEPIRINALSVGDVGIFKGKLSTQSPAIHRSPPIEGTGEKRLLLVLNPPERG